MADGMRAIDISLNKDIARYFLTIDTHASASAFKCITFGIA